MIRFYAFSVVFTVLSLSAFAQEAEISPLKITKQFPAQHIAHDRPNPIYIDVENTGLEIIRSASVSFVVANEKHVKQFEKTFTDLELGKGEQTRLRFDKKVNVNQSESESDVFVILKQVNGKPLNINEFGEPAGLILSENTARTSSSVDMTVFAEKFTSSTCGPCANWNINLYTPLLAQMDFNVPGSGRTIAKNQVPIPTAGDPSVNSFSNGRRGVYNVNSAPSMYVQGTRVNYAGVPNLAAAGDIFEDAVDDAASEPSFVTIDIDNFTATPVGNNDIEISVDGQIEALSNFGGQNVRLFIFVLNKDYVYSGALNGDQNYKHVTRTILPNATGERVLNFNTGTVQTFSETVTLTNSNGVVPANSTNLWNDRIEIVVVVQNRSGNDILQAAYANEFLSQDEFASMESAFTLYPNPSSDEGVLSFEMSASGSARVDVISTDGRTVYSHEINASQGEVQNIVLPTQHLQNGMYVVRLHQNNTIATKKWMVHKQ